MKFARLLQLFAIVFTFSNLLSAQTAPNLENGFKPYGSYDGSHLDTVSLLNGNLMLHAPLLPNYPQRGGRLAMQSFLYQTSKTWQAFCSVDFNSQVTCQWTLGRSGVNLRQSEGITIQRTLHQNSSDTGQITYKAYGYTIEDATGAIHQMIGTGPLDSTGEATEFDSIDISGYHLKMSNPDSYGVMNTATVTARDGSQYVINTWAGGSDTGASFCPQLPGNRSNPWLMTFPWVSKIALRTLLLLRLLTATGTSSAISDWVQPILWGETLLFSTGEPLPQTITIAAAAAPLPKPRSRAIPRRMAPPARQSYVMETFQFQRPLMRLGL
jgi:hypothetical protein